MNVVFLSYSKTVFMIDGDYFPAQSEPLPLRCSRARFRMKLFDFDEVEFSEVEGTFAGLSRSKYNGFPYWELRLVDESNQIRVLFPKTGGMFPYLLRHLVNRRFSYVDLILDRYDKAKRLIALLDGLQVEPQPLKLPKIRKYQIVDGRKTERHNYTARNGKIDELISEINTCNPHAHWE